MTTLPSSFAGFTLLRKLGEGGQSAVFVAQRPDVGTCALKLLRPEVAADPRYIDHFLTEADLSLLLLASNNLVRTFEAGEHEGRYYIAMELVEGQDLGLFAWRMRQLHAPLPVEFCCFVVAEILAGLAHLHDARGASGEPLELIHRDITPHNIFCSYSGRVVLGDFGIAHVKAYGAPVGAVGKLGYLAPEQLTAPAYDHRADLFACGIVLWELLTGARLFEGDEDEVLDRIEDAKVTRPSKLDPRVTPQIEKVVMAALERKPKDRYQDAASFRAALQPLYSPLICNELSLSAMLRTIFADDIAKRAGSPG